MRSMLAIVAALVFSCGVAFAQTDSGSSTGTATEQGGATGGAGEEKQITGDVKDVNKDQKQITIKGPQGNQVQYTLNDDTKIMSSTGEVMAIGALKSGSKVTITYTGSGANAMVTEVKVREGK